MSEQEEFTPPTNIEAIDEHNNIWKGVLRVFGYMKSITHSYQLSLGSRYKFRRFTTEQLIEYMETDEPIFIELYPYKYEPENKYIDEDEYSYKQWKEEKEQLDKIEDIDESTKEIIDNEQDDYDFNYWLEREQEHDWGLTQEEHYAQQKALYDDWLTQIKKDAQDRQQMYETFDNYMDRYIAPDGEYQDLDLLYEQVGDLTELVQDNYDLWDALYDIIDTNVLEPKDLWKTGKDILEETYSQFEEQYPSQDKILHDIYDAVLDNQATEMAEYNGFYEFLDDWGIIRAGLFSMFSGRDSGGLLPSGMDDWGSTWMFRSMGYTGYHAMTGEYRPSWSYAVSTPEQPIYWKNEFWKLYKQGKAQGHIKFWDLKRNNYNYKRNYYALKGFLSNKGFTNFSY